MQQNSKVKKQQGKGQQGIIVEVLNSWDRKQDLRNLLGIRAKKLGWYLSSFGFSCKNHLYGRHGAVFDKINAMKWSACPQ